MWLLVLCSALRTLSCCVTVWLSADTHALDLQLEQCMHLPTALHLQFWSLQVTIMLVPQQCNGMVIFRAYNQMYQMVVQAMAEMLCSCCVRDLLGACIVLFQPQHTCCLPYILL